MWIERGSMKRRRSGLPGFLMTGIFIFVLTAAMSSIIMSCTTSEETMSPGFTEANPFAKESTLLYQAPPFDKIHDSDYQPALEEGMRLKLLEIARIAANPEPPTFDNTIVEMEKSGQLLKRADSVFFSMISSNTNEELQNVLTEEAPKLAANEDAILLNKELFNRVKSIYDRRPELNLNEEQNYLLERYYLDFVQAGALLPDADKERLREINQESAKLQSDFQIRLLAATNNAALVISDRSELDGLSEAEIAAAAETARTRELEGEWVISLQNTTQQPAQVGLKNRSVRKRLFENSINRAELGDSNDTRQIISRLAELRAEKARMLGYGNFADYVL